MTAKLDWTRRYSEEDYLAFEATSPTRHDYLDGQIIPIQEIVAMSGGAAKHSRIKMNIAGLLNNALRGGPCVGYDVDMQVGLKRGYVYPDFSIVCEPSKFATEKELTLLNPNVIIEVLSPSTEHYDRDKKFKRYLELESFREFVLVSQDAPHVESFVRDETGRLYFAFASGLDAIWKIETAGVELPLAEVYENITFPPPPKLPVPLPEPEAD